MDIVSDDVYQIAQKMNLKSLVFFILRRLVILHAMSKCEDGFNPYLRFRDVLSHVN